MAEIQDWIKKQLKKGFKKEQIKDGLRKAGYQQDIIDSVDSLAKKNKQTKQLLIGLTVFLVVVIIVWLVIGNHAAKKEEVDGIQKFTYSSYFSQDHPTTLEELNNFLSVCSGFLGSEKLEDKEAILCSLGPNKEFNAYVPFIFYSPIPNFESGQYISITVNLNNLIKEKFPDISGEDYFNVNICGITEPLLEDPLSEEMNIERNLIFPEGEIFCGETFKLNISNMLSFTGFVPQVDSFNAEIYLVPQEVIPEILSKESFSEAKNKVESYTLLWQLEKPVVSQEQR